MTDFRKQTLDFMLSWEGWATVWWTVTFFTVAHTTTTWVARHCTARAQEEETHDFDRLSIQWILFIEIVFFFAASFLFRVMHSFWNTVPTYWWESCMGTCLALLTEFAGRSLFED